MLNNFFEASVTVPTFNSCTRWVGSLGIIHDSTPDCHPVSLAWMLELPQLNVALICKLRGSLMCLAYFLTCYPSLILQPGTDRRSVDWCRN